MARPAPTALVIPPASVDWQWQSEHRNPTLGACVSLANTELCQLLVLSARPRLTATQSRIARTLCSRDIDWPKFIDLAGRSFSLPLAYRNLTALGPDTVDETTRLNMQSQTVRLTMATLRMVNAQDTFQRTCLEPLQIDYAYMKGAAISAHYYGEVGLRFARDVDVLVAGDRIYELVNHALGAGYALVENSVVCRPRYEHQKIREIVEANDVITLLSGDGVPIEIHKRLGKDGFGYFNTNELLERKIAITINNRPAHLLSGDNLLPYICYHHTGHYWSRLHWLADLDAIVTHKSFELSAALESADRHHLRPTVEACLELNQLSSEVTSWDSVPASTHGKQLLNLCIKNLDADSRREFAMRKSIYPGWFAFKWQMDRLDFMYILVAKARRLVGGVDNCREARPTGVFSSLVTIVSRVFRYTLRAMRRNSSV